MVTERLDEAKVLVERLLQSKIYLFSDLKPSDLENRLAAVYAIFRKEDPQALYVGRTKNIRQRMYQNHLMGPTTNARLKKYLIQDKAISEVTDVESAKRYIMEYCYFQFIHEPNIEPRGRIEGLFSFILDVRYIHKEH
ncbi:MAG TPA: GIY-YIG nuclease family protein [Candidatus Limiplasma sp.]|nr:GIY-YIG nuclease family protein [Candidatus Limiplasma sp.]HRX09394.1 GIY-YIG nuclease family protein [Candidatus Limiplasma sp.]